MRAFVLIGIAMAAGALLAPAQADDRQAILEYKLTVPLANKLIAALPGITQLFVSRPDWKERMAKTARATLDERAREAEKSPETVELLKKNGLTPREYVVGVVTLRMALIAASRPASSPLPPSIVVSPENLAFAKAHLAELKPKMDAADRAGVPPQK